MVGDTAGMIAPLCGDGMAMALYGAELAVPLVGGLSPARGVYRLRLPAAATRPQLEAAPSGRACYLGRLLHHAYIRPPVAQPRRPHLPHPAPGLGRWVIRQTRG